MKYIKYVKFYVGHMFTIFFGLILFSDFISFLSVLVLVQEEITGSRGGGNSNKGGRGRGGRAGHWVTKFIIYHRSKQYHDRMRERKDEIAGES